VSGVSLVLIEGLEREGLEGRTILDLGCGVGGLTRTLLARGAARATGMDLSPASVAEASRLAGEAGLADRATYLIGDAAVAPLAVHDVVVMNKVVCCYPDPAALMSSAIEAAAGVVAFALPDSRGLKGVIVRFGLAVFNIGPRIRRSAFRVFAHDVRPMLSALERAGFEPRTDTRFRMWRALVYARAATVTVGGR